MATSTSRSKSTSRFKSRIENENRNRLQEYMSFKENLECRRYKVSVYISRFLKLATFQKRAVEKNKEKRRKQKTKNSDPDQRGFVFRWRGYMGEMLESLGWVLMGCFVLGWIALCYAFCRKHRHDLDRNLFHKNKSKHLSLWKPDLEVIGI